MIDALVRAMARRCGLEDPDAFAAKVLAWDTLHGTTGRPGPELQRGDHGTGRTTRMLLQALVALEAGCSVEVVAADRDHARDLLVRLRELGIAAQLAPGRDIPVVGGPLCVTWPGRVVKGPIDVRLVDHCAAERAAQREHVSPPIKGIPREPRPVPLPRLDFPREPPHESQDFAGAWQRPSQDTPDPWAC